MCEGRLNDISLGKSPMEGSCEQDNEPSGSVKDGDFLEQLSDNQLLKKNFTSLC
jgi:hypothetical protein